MLAAVLLLSLQSVATTDVVGGTDIAIEWEAPVAYAEADSGTVLGWDGRLVHWRAPSVCADARATVFVQFEKQSDGTRSFLIRPGRLASRTVLPALTVVRGDVEGEYEVQAPVDGRVEWLADAGALDADVSDEPCARARWALPRATRPGWTVVAALEFGGDRLLAWSVLARRADTDLGVRTVADAEVIVVVAGRRYAGRADATGYVRIRIAVPPNVNRALVIGPLERREADLAAPPTGGEHVLTSSKGDRWIFRIGPDGRPIDGAGPDGAILIERGVWRIPAPGLPDEPLDRGSAIAIAEGRPLERRSAEVDRWGVGPGVAAAPGLGIAPAVMLRAPALTHRPAAIVPRFASIGGTSVRHALTSPEARLWVLAASAWADVELRFRIGDWDVRPGAGAGAAVAWRRAGLRFVNGTDGYGAGILATAGFQIGRGPLHLDVRAILSSLALALDSSHLFGLGGLVWEWSR